MSHEAVAHTGVCVQITSHSYSLIPPSPVGGVRRFSMRDEYALRLGGSVRFVTAHVGM
jgi:hypothetical protein